MVEAFRTGTVVIPAYNEAGTVGSSLHKIAEVLKHKVLDISWNIVVVVDDGSSDGTADEVLAAKNDIDIPVTLFQHPVNRGLGEGIRNGIHVSSGDVVVIVDCDLSYSPELIWTLTETLVKTSARIVVASPYMPGGRTIEVPRLLEIRSRLANRFLSLMSQSGIATLTGMVRAYDGDFIRSLSLKAVDVDINVEIIYKTEVLRGHIHEIPADLDWSGLAARAGRTRVLNRRNRWNTYKLLVNGYLFRPFLFYGVPGVLNLIAGLVLISIGLFDRGFLVKYGLSLGILGTMLSFMSLMSLQVKRSFEELYFQSTQRSQGARAVLGSEDSMAASNTGRGVRDSAGVT